MKSEKIDTKIIYEIFYATRTTILFLLHKF